MDDCEHQWKFNSQQIRWLTVGVRLRTSQLPHENIMNSRNVGQPPTDLDLTWRSIVGGFQAVCSFHSLTLRWCFTWTGINGRTSDSNGEVWSENPYWKLDLNWTGGFLLLAFLSSSPSSCSQLFQPFAFRFLISLSLRYEFGGKK